MPLPAKANLFLVSLLLIGAPGLAVAQDTIGVNPEAVVPADGSAETETPNRSRRPKQSASDGGA